MSVRNDSPPNSLDILYVRTFLDKDRAGRADVFDASDRSADVLDVPYRIFVGGVLTEEDRRIVESSAGFLTSAHAQVTLRQTVGGETGYSAAPHFERDVRPGDGELKSTNGRWMYCNMIPVETRDTIRGLPIVEMVRREYRKE